MQIIKVIRQVLMIIMLSFILALIVNHIRSDGLPLVADWSPEARLVMESGESLIIPLENAAAWWAEEGAVFLDARSPQEYAQGHIRGARNVPWQSFDQYIDRVWGRFPDDTRMVTYCDGVHCSLGEDLARELMAMGYTQVRVLVNGWTRWVEAGLPVDTGL